MKRWGFLWRSCSPRSGTSPSSSDETTRPHRMDTGFCSTECGSWVKSRCRYTKDPSMQYRELHPWRVSVTEAQRIQQCLRRHIQVGTYVRDIRYIAGADISVAPTTLTVYAGVVVLDYTTLAIVERKGIVSTTDFPYIPGLLSFREAPALLQVFAQLERTPDVVVFDGQRM